MIVLDTTIISEVMCPQPNAAVVAWLNQHCCEDLFMTSITIAEIGYGLRILADSQRRQVLQYRFDQFIQQGFEHRILDFDKAAALVFAELMAAKKRLGYAMSFPDAQIAAITKSRLFNLATRNVKDFENCGIVLMNPF